MTSTTELDRLLTSKEVAAILQVSQSTLCRWREHHDGPPWVSLGSIPRYRAIDIARWTESRLQGLSQNVDAPLVRVKRWNGDGEGEPPIRA